jgi:threonine/homoserine/homoserine lactone efflux protein
MDCSHKFREANEFAKEKSKQGTLRIIWSVIIILFGIFYITEAEVLFGLIFLGIGAYLVYSGYKLKKESEDIALNKYNASCYHN